MCVVVDRFSFEVPFKFEYALNSVFNQNYTNYFVVVVGDGSKASNAFLRKYLHFYGIPKERFIFLENKEKAGTLEATLNAVNNHCSKDSLVLNLAGEDELIGRNVLKAFNAAYRQGEGRALVLYSNVYYYSQGRSLDYGKSGEYHQADVKADTFRKGEPKYDASLLYHS
jgi:glycosyltransferase involved in cell wall biosynthesis